MRALHILYGINTRSFFSCCFSIYDGFSSIFLNFVYIFKVPRVRMRFFVTIFFDSVRSFSTRRHFDFVCVNVRLLS